MRYGIEAPSAEQSASSANSPANSPSTSPSESSAAPALPRAPMVTTSLASDANTFDAEQAALAAKEARLLWRCSCGAVVVALLLWHCCYVVTDLHVRTSRAAVTISATGATLPSTFDTWTTETSLVRGESWSRMASASIAWEALSRANLRSGRGERRIARVSRLTRERRVLSFIT